MLTTFQYKSNFNVTVAAKMVIKKSCWELRFQLSIPGISQQFLPSFPVRSTSVLAARPPRIHPSHPVKPERQPGAMLSGSSVVPSFQQVVLSSTLHQRSGTVDLRSTLPSVKRFSLRPSSFRKDARSQCRSKK